MRRVPVVDIVSPRPNQEEPKLRITDDEIDKIFNSNCGHFEEVKKEKQSKTSSLIKEINSNVKEQNVKPSEPVQVDIRGSSIKSPQKPLEPQTRDDKKLKGIDENKKSEVEKTVKPVTTQETVKPQNKNEPKKFSEQKVKPVPLENPKPKVSEKIVAAEEKKTIETVKPITAAEPDLKPEVCINLEQQRIVFNFIILFLAACSSSTRGHSPILHDMEGVVAKPEISLLKIH